MVSHRSRISYLQKRYKRVFGPEEETCLEFT